MSDSPFTPTSAEAEVSSPRDVRVPGPSRRNAALGAGGAAALVAIAGWFVLFAGEEELVSAPAPVAAAPSPPGPATPLQPTPQATDPPPGLDLDHVTGRDPFLPLVAAPAAVESSFGASPAPTPEATPSGSAGSAPIVTPAPAPAPAPAGKKKPVPTTGPVL